MEAFCREIMEDIKASKSERELIMVIGNSMSQLRKRNSFNEAGYIMNMLAAMRATNRDDLPGLERNNIALAIEIFRQFQKESRERIF